MPMRLSGLMSGMDTESIVSQLVEARKTKVTKAVKAQKSLKYKQDAWKSLNTQILNLYNKSLSNLRFESSYIKKTTKVSNSSVVSVITGENAMNSVQNLTVSNLAKSAFLTGGELELKTDADGNPAEEGATVTGKTKLSQLGFNIPDGEDGAIKVTVGGKSTNITVDGNRTMENFVSALRSAGLNANFDETNQRFYVSAKSSGAKNDFSIMAMDEAGFKALESLKLSYGYGDQTVIKGYQTIIDKYNDGSTLRDRLENRQDSLANYWTSLKDNRVGILQGLSEEAVKEINNQLTGADFSLEIDKSGDEPKLVKKNADGTTAELANGTDAEWETIDAAIKAAQSALKTKADGALSDEDKKAALDLAASFDGWIANQEELTAVETNFVGSSTSAGGGVQLENGKPKLAAHVIKSIEDEVKKEADDAQDVINKLNVTLTEEQKKAMGQKAAGEDAKITLNNVDYTSDKNTFVVNGLTLTVSATTSDPVTITTEDDTNGIYDMIKNFFKEYNTLINQMDKLYNADSAKGYEPLTDEEKEAMSDSAIEEWENKIKDSVLRKDSVLGTFSGALKKIMMEGVEVNGKKMYLSNFGINTLNYFASADNEKNAYHIDGDPDDTDTSGNADKLKTMIADDPDTVVSFFTQLSKKLYNEMFDQMKAKEGYSSAMTVYDDKKMQEDYDDYTAKIKELEKKLADYEDKWYAKFAAMETALAKMQNNASAVTSLLGG